jgi:hypothetical protein
VRDDGPALPEQGNFRGIDIPAVRGKETRTEEVMSREEKRRPHTAQPHHGRDLQAALGQMDGVS